MEKEQILSELTNRIGQTSLSPKTLTDYINENLPAEGTEPDDAYWNKHTNVLKSLNGNYSHDVATLVEDFKKNYKPQQPQSSIETGENGNNGNGGKGDESELAKQLSEALKIINVFKEEREAEKKAIQVQSLMKNAQLKLKEQIENGGKNLCNDGILEIAMSKVTYSDGMTEEDVIANLKSNYEKSYKSVFGNSANPFEGNGQSVEPDNSKNYIEILKERDKANEEKRKVVESELK